MNRTLALAIAGLITVSAGRADASIIPLGSIDLSGQGFGGVLNILSLQDAGPGDGTESGSVSWNGSSDVELGEAKNTSQTRTIAELMAFGISSATEFGLIYNVNQQGNLGGLDTDINDFSVTVYSAAGAALQTFSWVGDSGDGTCTPSTGDPDCYPVIGNGTGASGYLFGFDAEQAAQLQAYFLVGTNRIGMSGSISLANDGQENFTAYDLNGDVPELSEVPEPASMFLLGTGLVGLAAKVRSRRKK
jgi:hypothetical protein